MTIDGTNLHTQNSYPVGRIIAIAGLCVAGVLSGAAKCEGLAPPTSSPAPASIPAGTNFYTKPMRLGDTACGKTTRAIENVAPVKSETIPGGNSAVVNDGYSHTVIVDALNPDNTCGEGDAEGILWQQAQTVTLPGPGLGDLH